MKDSLSSVDVYYLLKELKKLEGTKIDRVYHSAEKSSELLIALHMTGIGKHFLKINLPAMMMLTEYKEEYETPTGLCMMLRKNIEGAFLTKISQIRLERIVRLDIKGKDKDFILYIELFSKGNIIFCDKDNKILNLVEEQKWSQRIVKRGEIYQSPLSKIDMTALIFEAFEELLLNSQMDSLVKTLAIGLSIGGRYAEEICTRCDIDKKSKSKDITNADGKKLFKEVSTFLDQQITANYTDNEVFPIKMKSLETYSKDSSKESKLYDSFNDAIRQNWHEPDKKQIKLSKEYDRIASIILEQEKSLKECETTMITNKESAETIYKNYQLVDDIIKTLRQARKTFEWKDIKLKISKDPNYGKIIKKIDEDKGTIILELN